MTPCGRMSIQGCVPSTGGILAVPPPGPHLVHLCTRGKPPFLEEKLSKRKKLLVILVVVVRLS